MSSLTPQKGSRLSWTEVLSGQLAELLDTATRSAVKDETRVFRKRTLLIQHSRARVEAAFYEEMLRLEEAVEQLNIGSEAGEKAVERRPEDEISGDESVLDTPTSSQPEKEEKRIDLTLNSRPIKLTRSGGRGGRNGG